MVRKKIRDLYDKHVNSLGSNHESIYVNTRFGSTHIIKLGEPNAKPLLLLHGGNSTAAYSLK